MGSAKIARVRRSYTWNSLTAAVCVVAFANTAAGATAQAASHWKDLQRSGTEALDNNAYWIAEPTLKKAVIQAGSFGPADIRLAESLGELGRLYTVRGRFDEAEPYLEEQLHVMETALGDDNPEIIPAMGSLIQFYLNHGTAEKADPLTEQMLSYVQGKLNEPGALTRGKMTVKKGVALEGWVGEAAPVMRDPIIEWAITCDAVGNIYRTRGNFDLADRLFKAALDIKTTVLGNKHLSLANSYDNLGTLCLERNDYGGAATYFRSALEMTEKILSPDNPQVYSRLDKLARCLIKSGKEKDAEQLYQRAQAFWKDDDSHAGERARVMYALGSLYVDEKNYEAAAPILQHALELVEQADGPSSITLVPYLQRYAYDLYYLKRKPEVEDLRARASTISGAL
jgi:tetratricopeptide (TPR) repeat protein